MRVNINDLQPNNKRKLIFSVVTGLVIVLGILGFFLFFPHLLNNQKLIDIVYVENAAESRVVTLYQEEGSSDDGSYLSGYWVYLLEPTTGKTIHKIFLKRKDDNFPPSPKIYCLNNNELWIIGAKGMYQGDIGFNAMIKIENNKLVLTPTPFLQGWNVTGVYQNTLTLVNQFNENGCLDLNTHKLEIPACQYVSEIDTTEYKNDCFFFVKNTNTSTRSHLYYYQTGTRFPPPGVFAGFIEEGKPVPGWHLPDLINIQYGSISQTDLTTYQSAFDTTENVNIIDEKQLFNTPYKLYDKNGICILFGYDNQSKSGDFYQYNTEGKLIWKVSCPKLKGQTSAISTECIYRKEETILINTQNWAISINNSSGKINWQCPR